MKTMSCKVAAACIAIAMLSPTVAASSKTGRHIHMPEDEDMEGRELTGGTNKRGKKNKGSKGCRTFQIKGLLQQTSHAQVAVGTDVFGGLIVATFSNVFGFPQALADSGVVIAVPFEVNDLGGDLSASAVVKITIPFQGAMASF
eukprot:9866668-Ditylum_brightwellii.AAC.1